MADTKLVICEKCFGTGHLNGSNENSTWSKTCEYCHGSGFTRVKMTNADRIRAMSNEELALWICGVYDIEEENGKFINGIIIPGYTPNDIEEWLQMPAEDDE